MIDLPYHQFDGLCFFIDIISLDRATSGALETPWGDPDPPNRGSWGSTPQSLARGPFHELACDPIPSLKTTRNLRWT